MTNLDEPFGPATAWSHGGARALARLHERHLREFIETWRRAKTAGVSLPETKDRAYASFEALLHHVLRAGKGYLGALCGMLEVSAPHVPDPPEPAPGAGSDGASNEVGPVEAGADAFVEVLLAAYREPFRQASERNFYKRTGTAPWGVDYCVDALFEHAVLHPVRHSLQLEDLLACQ